MLSTHCNLFDLVESLSLHRDFFPSTDFSHKFLDICVFHFSSYKLIVNKFSQKKFLYTYIGEVRGDNVKGLEEVGK